MTIMVKFPHIEQFRNVVRQVTDTTRYIGKGENGDPIYNPNVLLPKLKCVGTTKIHGSNSGIGVLNDGTIWAQSRERIITPENDNFGFATFVHKNREEFQDIFSKFNYDTTKFKGIVLFGEYAGKGIQKGVAVSELDKMFVAFGAKLISDTEDSGNVWVADDDIITAVGHRENSRIFNIFTFGSWEIEVDFNHPELVTNQLIALTEKVEEECPVGKFFGVSGVGEGICWKSATEPYVGGKFMWKVKGDKHSASKVKKLASVDVERVNSINECVDKIITENRLNQGIDHLRMNSLEFIPQNLGSFIKWVTTDAIREELDTIIESGLEPKDIGSAGSKVAREWFLTKFNNGDFE